ncbi:MAG: sulfurtransferase [Burkholderiaceae bacterium]|nr:sulfurtransferase [Burkholderiaceae bacterium]MCD8517533.1 sulfurtransferase [Burkholderiaceae bacterium]MCD8537916.1 sulfurtransferase [Burkholderiaceae bacterium]MCD8565888.1 sulfurtransferase [Burkholderiaceae bacterium]
MKQLHHKTLTRSITHLIGAAALTAISSLAMAAQPLLDPVAVAQLAGNPDVRIIDIRAPKDYNEGHIAGAASAPYGKWRGPSNNPGELPPLNKLTELVQNLGLTPETHAIVVSSGTDDTDFGAAARVYWTLKVLGLQNLSILNGGIKAWQASGQVLSATVPQIAKSNFTPTINQSLLVSQDQLTKDAQSTRAVLVDARPADFFNGETRHVAAKTPGTLPGAVNVSHSVWFKPGTSQVIDAEQAKSIAAKYNLANTDKEVVSFCNTGHWAATNWFVLSELVGDQDVKLYAGSMVDWTQASTPLPMDNVPGRFKQLVIDAKLWFAGL